MGNTFRPKRVRSVSISLILFASLCAGLVKLSAAGSENRIGNGLLARLPEEVPAREENPPTPEKIALGKQLFFDPRLSGDNTMSCATCHLPEKAFADGLPKARGRNGTELARNTPTLLNAGFLSVHFWDGRAGSLEEQALMPLQAPERIENRENKENKRI